MNNESLLRRKRVAELTRDGVKHTAISTILEQENIINPRTGKPYSPATIASDVKMVSELIGRTGVNVFQPMWSRYGTTRTQDSTRADYRFWDKLRRGFADGFKFGGLYCQPLVQTLASFVLAKGWTVSLEDKPGIPEERRTYTNDLLARWGRRIHAQLLTICEDTYALGDQFVVVNADGSLFVPSPDTVQPLYDRYNARNAIQYTITSLLENATITDIYTASHRILKIKEFGKGGKEQVYTYTNLIGRLPVVHFANDRSANEQYGRPIYEGLYHLFERWDILFEKTIDGVELHGNPLPVFENLEDIAATIEANATAQAENGYDAFGNPENRTLLQYDRLGAIMLGKGGRATMLSPNVGFTSDIRTVLREMFLMVANYTRMPEGMWAGATEKGDIEDKILPFIKFIESRRSQFDGEGADDVLGNDANGGLLELADIWLRTRRLTDPKVIVAPVRSQYAHLRLEDEQITLQKAIWSHSIGAIGRADALSTLNLVADPVQAVQRATEQMSAAPDEETFKRMLDQMSYRDTDPQSAVPEPADDIATENPAGGKPANVSEQKNYTAGLDRETAKAREKTLERRARMDDDDPDAYKPRPGDDAKTKSSGYTKAFENRYGERLKGDRSLAAIARVVAPDFDVDTRRMLRALRTVYKRGQAAWRTGSRPGATQSQWARARVYSFIMKGKTYRTADKDIADGLKDDE